MEKYKEVVAENDKIVMIQISLDQSRAAAEAWAVADKLPWYTILPGEHVENSGFYKFKSTQYVPEYVLLDASGKKLGGGAEVFAKVKELVK